MAGPPGLIYAHTEHGLGVVVATGFKVSQNACVKVGPWRSAGGWVLTHPPTSLLVPRALAALYWLSPSTSHHVWLCFISRWNPHPRFFYHARAPSHTLSAGPACICFYGIKRNAHFTAFSTQLPLYLLPLFHKALFSLLRGSGPPATARMWDCSVLCHKSPTALSQFFSLSPYLYYGFLISITISSSPLGFLFCVI